MLGLIAKRSNFGAVFEETMGKESSLKRMVLLALILVVPLSLAIHFHIVNPLGVSRALYLFQSQVGQWGTACSKESPLWMAKIMRYGTRNLGSPASQLVYLEPEGTLHHCETGWMDGFWSGERVKEETRFRFASVTKSITASAVVDLINREELSLDSKVVSILGVEGGPFKDPRVSDITIEHLLTHRAGWDRDKTQDSMFMRNDKPWCPYEPQHLTSTTLQYAAGEEESYSNVGYCLLGLVIEQVSGRPYREYVSDRFGFEGTTLKYVDGPYLPDEVKYDTRHEDFYTDNYYKYFDFYALSSSAGLSGSASDLARVIARQIGNEPLNILSGGMHKKCNPVNAGECYGYGVARFQSVPDSMSLYIQGGMFPGNMTAVIIDENGGVLVWLGAGSPKQGRNAREEFYQLIYEVLSDYYGLN